MKNIPVFLILLFALTAPTVADTSPCPDINCYFERKAQAIETQRRQQQEELENYRAEQLRMQEEQLNQIQKQNELLEGQLEELEEQNRLHEEELKELQKLRPPDQNAPKSSN